MESCKKFVMEILITLPNLNWVLQDSCNLDSQKSCMTIDKIQSVAPRQMSTGQMLHGQLLSEQS